jgi:hypothetical protein
MHTADRNNRRDSRATHRECKPAMRLPILHKTGKPFKMNYLIMYVKCADISEDAPPHRRWVSRADRTKRTVHIPRGLYSKAKLVI